jgi:hypothetical protein
MDKCHLIDFTITKSLLSNSYIKGQDLFGLWVYRLYEAKQAEDEMKKNKNPAANGARRNVIKLLLNTASGKLLSNPRIHSRLVYLDQSEKSQQFLNGVPVKKVYDMTQQNLWVHAGVGVYD